MLSGYGNFIIMIKNFHRGIIFQWCHVCAYVPFSYLGIGKGERDRGGRIREGEWGRVREGGVMRKGGGGE